MRHGPLLLLAACLAALTCPRSAQSTVPAGTLTEFPFPVTTGGGGSDAGKASALDAGKPEDRAGYFVPQGYPDRRLFYFYFQARDPDTWEAKKGAPTLLWLNGGPGCSSLFGLFFENGPYTIDKDLQAVRNPHTWASFANLLYLDQPIWTGLSYSKAGSDNTNTLLDVATTVLGFLEAFFAGPPLRASPSAHPIFLTGESFAGHYLPSIAAMMRHSRPDWNLQGVAMFNPCTDAPTMYESYIQYGRSRNLISSAIASQMSKHTMAQCKLQAAICSTFSTKELCNEATSTCETLLDAVLNSPKFGRRNYYDISKTCEDSTDCYLTLSQRLRAYVAANKKAWGAGGVSYQDCGDRAYWNLRNDMARSYGDLIGVLLDDGVRVAVLCGVQDVLCNWMGNARWLDGLSWTHAGEYAKARYTKWASGTYKAAANLVFVKVEGAGHMAPMDQPAAVQALMAAWVHGNKPPVKLKRAAVL